MREKLRENKPSPGGGCPDSGQSALIPVSVENLILVIRGQRVIVDYDLAYLYGTTTKALNQALKRNRERFPPDFLFQISEDEKDELVTNCDQFKKLKHSSRLPNAFTEHGAIMAATVLNSPRAILTSIYVVRAFVHLRTVVFARREVMERLDEIERKVGTHDEAIGALLDAIRMLMTPPASDKRKIGFELKKS